MVRHVIVFNAEVSHEHVLRMAARAQQVLTMIPGVTDVRFGVAATPSAAYRYLFDIGFEDEAVIDIYRTHPVHARFAEEEFRPVVKERISNDYKLM